MPGDVGIRLAGLTKTFGPVRAVKALSFSAPYGQITGLLGPNGAGKTTTLRMLATVLRPTAGRAWVNGWDIVRDLTEVRRALGILPDQSGLYARLTARETMAYFAALHGVPEDVAARRVEALAETLDLVPYLDRLCGSLSRGMSTKVALARALVHDPPVLLLDEPTAGLDVLSRRQVRDLIVRLRDHGRCVLLCTHLLEEAEALCDRVAILVGGCLRAWGTPEELRRVAGGRSLEEAFVRAVGADHSEEGAGRGGDAVVERAGEEPCVANGSAPAP